MNEKLRELFSAYLDGRGTAEERKLVETTIYESPAAREELEAMRAFHSDLKASKLPDIQAPPEFRQNIMRRIQTQAGGNSTGTGGLGKGLFFNTTTSWVVMGIVLTGLLGTLIVRDLKKQHQTPAEQPARIQKDLPVSEQAAQAKDLSGLPETKMKTVAAQDIQAVPGADNLQGLKIGTGRLNGEVYVSGSGRASKQGRLAFSGSSTWEAQIDLSEQKKSSGRLGLENPGQWTNNQIRARLKTHAIEGTVQAGEIAALAQKHNLHPGLLLAVKKQLPRQELEALAEKVRSSMNQTVGKTEQERLLAIIKALKGKAEWIKQWQKIIKSK